MNSPIPHTTRCLRSRADGWRPSAGLRSWLAAVPLTVALALFGASLGGQMALGDDDSAPDAPVAAAPAGDAPAAPSPRAKGRNDPLVQSIMESKPKTAEELTHAITTLVDVRQTALAKVYLQQLAALKMSPAESDRLLDAFGTSAFIEIAQVPELAATAGPFVHNLLADAQAFRRDPARIAKMIAALGSPDRYTRQTALHSLERSREPAAVAMIGVLGDPKRAKEHAAVRAALGQMGSAAIGPAESALQSHNPALEAQMVSLLADLGDKSAAIFMVRAAVDPASPEELSHAAHAAILQLSGGEVSLVDGRRALAAEVRRLMSAAVRMSDSDPAVIGAEMPQASAPAKPAKRAAKPADDAAGDEAAADDEKPADEKPAAAPAKAKQPKTEPPVFANAPTLVEVYRWDAKSHAPALLVVPQAIAWADRAAQLARDLLGLSAADAPAAKEGAPAARVDAPADAPAAAANRAPSRDLTVARELAEFQYLSLAAGLTAERLNGDLDQPLQTGAGTAHDLAVALGADALDRVLAEALTAHNAFAAAAAAEILGEIGSAALLTRQGARPAPLAEALQSADRRVRFAALGAIMQIAPKTRFPGDGYLPVSLMYFANTRGGPRVLIGHPRREMAQYLAGLLAGEGYETDVTTTGREMFRLASTSPDYDFALLHYSISDPQLDDLLTMLRREPTTRRLPLGLLALSPDLMRTEHIAQSVAPAIGMPEPGEPHQMAIRSEQLLRLQGRNRVPFAARQRQARAAIGWIGALVLDSPKRYELSAFTPILIELLNVPGFEEPALEPLVALGGVRTEQALLDIADSNVESIESRQRAAEAFVRCVEKHGVLLRRTEIERQYALYNASERAGAEVQAVLAQVLDAIEARGEEKSAPGLKNMAPVRRAAKP